MFNERLIDTLKELIFYVKQIANGGGGGGSDDGGSDGGGSDGGSVAAPLFVEGELDDGGDGVFTPNSDQPTWNEAKEAFLSGTLVFLKIVDSEQVILIDALAPSYYSSGLALGAQGAGYVWPETIGGGTA